MNAIEAQFIDPQAFAAMPAILADPQALQRSATPHRIFVIDGADPEDFEFNIPRITRIPLVSPSLARRFISADYTRGCIAVLHRFGPTGELEIVFANHRIVLTRGIIRNLANWIFDSLATRRLVARIRGSDRQTQDLVRRLGFQFEGRAKQYFSDDEDASMWAMTVASCHWLR